MLSYILYTRLKLPTVWCSCRHYYLVDDIYEHFIGVSYHNTQENTKIMSSEESAWNDLWFCVCNTDNVRPWMFATKVTSRILKCHECHYNMLIGTAPLAPVNDSILDEVTGHIPYYTKQSVSSCDGAGKLDYDKFNMIAENWSWNIQTACLVLIFVLNIDPSVMSAARHQP